MFIKLYRQENRLSNTELRRQWLSLMDNALEKNDTDFLCRDYEQAMNNIDYTTGRSSEFWIELAAQALSRLSIAGFHLIG